MAVSLAVSVAYGLVLFGWAGDLPGGLAIPIVAAVGVIVAASPPVAGRAVAAVARWRGLDSLAPVSRLHVAGLPAHDRGIGLLLDFGSRRVLPVHARLRGRRRLRDSPPRRCLHSHLGRPAVPFCDRATGNRRGGGDRPVAARRGRSPGSRPIDIRLQGGVAAARPAGRGRLGTPLGEAPGGRSRSGAAFRRAPSRDPRLHRHPRPSTSRWPHCCGAWIRPASPTG